MWLTVLAAFLAVGAYVIRPTDNEYVIWPNFGTIPRNAVEVEVEQVGWARYLGGSLSVGRRMHIKVPCPDGIIRAEWLFPSKVEEVATPVGSTDPTIDGNFLRLKDVEEILHIVYYKPPPGAFKIQWRVIASDRECEDHQSRNQVVQIVGIPGREYLSENAPKQSPIGE